MQQRTLQLRGLPVLLPAHGCYLRRVRAFWLLRSFVEWVTLFRAAGACQHTTSVWTQEVNLKHAGSPKGPAAAQRRSALSVPPAARDPVTPLASCTHLRPATRRMCADAPVRCRHRRSRFHSVFLNNISTLQLVLLVCYATPCASKRVTFARVRHFSDIQWTCRSRTITLYAYSTAEAAEGGLGGTCTAGVRARGGFLCFRGYKGDSRTRTDSATGMGSRCVEQPQQRGRYTAGSAGVRYPVSRQVKRRIELAFVRAPPARATDLFTWSTAGRTPKPHANADAVERHSRSHTWGSAPPRITTARNNAQKGLQLFFSLGYASLSQARTCTSLRQTLLAHRENAISLGAAAVLTSKHRKNRSSKSTCRNPHNDFSLVFTSRFASALRGEPPAPHSTSHAGTPTHGGAGDFSVSAKMGSDPFSSTPASVTYTTTTAVKAGESPSGVEFLRGGGAAWNVCSESDWKTYSREELLSDGDKSGRSLEKPEKGVANRALYNVQGFPADVLSSSPTSGRLRAEQMRGRGAYVERLAAETAAAGGDKAGLSKAKSKRKGSRSLTWRDYLSWLPPRQPQYNLPHSNKERRISQQNRQPGEGGNRIGFLKSQSSTKEKDTYDEWEGFPPSASTPIEDLPLETLVWDNETIIYRQAFKEAPMIVDEETFRRLECRWTDAELKRVQREEKEVYGIPNDVPDDCWIPLSPNMPEGRLVQEYGLLPNITLTAGGYDYIETYHDPVRNYTWSYKRWNPLKQEGERPRNLEAEARSIYELETEKSRRYWHEEAHPPPLKPDDGIFRQATVANEMIKGMKRTPLGVDQWHYTPTHPWGQAAELQNFWLTAVKRTLREATAGLAAEATAAAAVGASMRVQEDDLPSSQTISRMSSETQLTGELPLWVRCPDIDDSSSVGSGVAFRKVSSQAGAAPGNSPAPRRQHDVASRFKCTPCAVLAEPGSRNGDEAGSEPPALEEGGLRRGHARTISEKRSAAIRTDTSVPEAVGKLSPRTCDEGPELEGAGGAKDRRTKSASEAALTRRAAERILGAQRSAYQPLAFPDAENDDAGATGSADDMKYRRLGKSDLFVSEVGVGTMNVGSPPLSEHRTKQLLTYAVDAWGVNFIDTAELYPLPAAPHTYGTAEEIIGQWLRSTGRRSGPRREELVIATKVAGPSPKLAWLRSSCDSCGHSSEKSYTHEEPGDAAGRQQSDAAVDLHAGGERAQDTWVEGCRGICNAYPGTSLSRSQIIQAAEGSLGRLQTDYIDLFQLHWPERYVPMQSSGNAADVLYDPEEAHLQQPTRDSVAMEEQLDAVKELLRQGKIRAWGLSNETPYGVSRFTRLATQIGLPPPASVQLQYNLLCRNDVEKGFVELARPQNAGTGIVAYGALAGGILTGKYLEWLEKPTTGRLLRFPSYMKRYRGSLAARAVTAYYYVALKLGHPNLTVMALRWVLTRPFICSTLLGFTDYHQLRENLYCIHQVCGVLSDWAEREINFLHWKWRDALRVIQ